MTSSTRSTFMKAGALGASLALGTAVAALPMAGASGAVRAEAKALAVEGDAVFDCVLAPFNMAFRYEGRYALRAERADGGGDQYDLSLSVPDIPGIAPVAITDGRMEATFSGTVGDLPVEFWAETPVTVEANDAVPVAPARAVGVTVAAGDEVRLESLVWAFDEIDGLATSAECQEAKGGDLGALASGKESTATAEPAAGGDVAQGPVEASEATPTGMLVGGGLVLAAGLAAVVAFVSRRRAQGA